MPKVNVEPGPYPKINSSVRKNFKGVVTLKEQGEVYKEGLTQDELAELLNIDRYELSYYENGQKEIPVSLLMQMAKALNCSIDLLLGMPFDYAYNKQNNNLTTITLSQVQRGFYKLDDKLKGIMKFDAKFADRPNNICAYLLQSDSSVLGLLKGDAVIVDKDIRHYINNSMNQKCTCMLSGDYIEEGKHGVATAYYFSEVGVATDLYGNKKKRSFYYYTHTGELKIVGCQVIQRICHAVVIQSVKYHLLDVK